MVPVWYLMLATLPVETKTFLLRPWSHFEFVTAGAQCVEAFQRSDQRDRVRLESQPWAGLRVWPTAKGIYYCSGQPLTVEGASSPLLYFCLLVFVYVASCQVVEKTAGWPPPPHPQLLPSTESYLWPDAKGPLASCCFSC